MPTLSSLHSTMSVAASPSPMTPTSPTPGPSALGRELGRQTKDFDIIAAYRKALTDEKVREASAV